MLCTTYFNILNSLGVDHQRDRWKNRLTDRIITFALIVSKGSTNLCVAIAYATTKTRWNLSTVMPPPAVSLTF